MDEDK